MSNLIKSTVILAFARFTNYALLIFSPILLVRILDPYSFGQYREFMAYAMLVASLAEFSVKSNLLYFIPHSPKGTVSYVSHTNWLVIGTSTIACVALWIFREPILGNTSFNFLIPLAAFVVLFVNFDFLESYWLATKQANNVFYYSTLLTTVRLAAVVGTALVARSVDAMLNALITVEIIRIVAVLFILRRLHLLSFGVDLTILKRQLAFVIPLGFAASLHHVNQYVGQIAISTQLGVAALAIYTIGSYQVPILNIVRGAIGDAIFPDMVREAASRSNDNLRLWKRGNIAYSFLIVPIFVVLIWYADLLIPLIFTEQYTSAVGIFRILLLVLIIQCFELSSPLRAANRNKTLLVGNLLMLATNVACILVFFLFFEGLAIFGPAIGIILGYLIQLVFFGQRISQIYSIRIRNLLKWRSLAIVSLCAALSFPLLVVGELVVMPDLARLPVFSILFAIAYFVMIHRAHLEEVETVSRLFGRKLLNVTS